MALYQDIMKVPGLTGTWRDRLKQYYSALTGKNYRGTKEEGLYMLGQIKAGNFPQAQAPQAQQPPPVEDKPLFRQYTDPLTGQLTKAAEIPQFENVLPFMKAWERLLPNATEAARSQIDPESMRNYTQAYRDYASGLTSSGGQRFGTGLSGFGNIKAGAERQRRATLNDWLNQQRGGFESLWYNPSKDAWNTARTQANSGTVTAPDIPTWQDYVDMSGGNTTTGSGSPFYG